MGATGVSVRIADALDAIDDAVRSSTARCGRCERRGDCGEADKAVCDDSYIYGYGGPHGRPGYRQLVLGALGLDVNGVSE